MKLSLDCPDLFKNGASEKLYSETWIKTAGTNLPLENEAPELSVLQGIWMISKSLMERKGVY